MAFVPDAPQPEPGKTAPPSKRASPARNGGSASGSAAEREVSQAPRAHSNTTRALRQYQQAQIETASPTRLVVLLYDGAIRFGSLALEAMQARRIEEQHKNLIRAQRIVSELMTSLDKEAGGDVANNLYRLYAYLMEQLVHANLYDDTAALEGALQMLNELRETWVEVDRLSGQGQANDAERKAA